MLRLAPTWGAREQRAAAGTARAGAGRPRQAQKYRPPNPVGVWGRIPRALQEDRYARGHGNLVLAKSGRLSLLLVRQHKRSFPSSPVANKSHKSPGPFQAKLRFALCLRHTNFILSLFTEALLLSEAWNACARNALLPAACVLTDLVAKRRSLRFAHGDGAGDAERGGSESRSPCSLGLLGGTLTLEVCPTQPRSPLVSKASSRLNLVIGRERATHRKSA